MHPVEFKQKPGGWNVACDLSMGTIYLGWALFCLSLCLGAKGAFDGLFMLGLAVLGGYCSYDKFYWVYVVLAGRYTVADPRDAEADELSRRIGETAINGDWEEHRRLMAESMKKHFKRQEGREER